MSLPDKLNLKYTIVFDFFPLPELLNHKSEKSDQYLKNLISKEIITQSLNFKQSDWITSVTENNNIFTEKKSGSHYNIIDTERWSQRLNNLISPTSATPSIDYRFSTIEIIPIDTDLIMSANKPVTSFPKRSIAGERLTAELLGAGVVRLYRDSDGHLNESMISDKSPKLISGGETTVAILGVPFYFTASDLLLGFFDQDDTSKISHMRLVKSSSPNRFMLLLKFREPEYVKQFLRKYQGRKFNSFEPEKCSIVEVKEITFRSKPANEVRKLNSSLPYLLEDPFTKEKLENCSKPCSYTELATCPVCLDRLDSTTSGLFTIPCQHTYHSSCLSKWKDDTCPVCRYSNKDKMKPTSNNISNSFSNGETNLEIGTNQVERCTTCNSTENLWICLICGNVGCGRYNEKHAIQHWESTGHCFAMEADGQRVWDYAADGYVHRLVQNEADGKIVELPLRDESKKSNDEKVDKIGFEYSKMLIDQLENQRLHYESQMQDLFLEISTKNKFIEKFNNVEQQLASINSQFEENERNNEKQLNSLNIQLTELNTKNIKLTELNKTFIKTIKELKRTNELLSGQNQDLKEQVRDLMFFLESQERFKDASEDIKQGTIISYPEL